MNHEPCAHNELTTVMPAFASTAAEQIFQTMEQMQMKSVNRKVIGLSAAAAVLAASFGVAVAQQVESQTDLTITQVVQKLEALGYTAIEGVEKDDGVWEAEATAPNGTRVELDLDLKDARILKEERDDDDSKI
jgi:hypothetical protein